MMVPLYVHSSDAADERRAAGLICASVRHSEMKCSAVEALKFQDERTAPERITGMRLTERAAAVVRSLTLGEAKSFPAAGGGGAAWRGAVVCICQKQLFMLSGATCSVPTALLFPCCCYGTEFQSLQQRCPQLPDFTISNVPPR